MENKNLLKEDLGLSTGVGIANPEVPLVKPNDKFAGLDVFDVDEHTFHKSRLGKLKFKHWKTFVGKDDTGKGIREYAVSNGKNAIILKNKSTGAMTFLRGSHLDFNKGSK